MSGSPGSVRVAIIGSGPAGLSCAVRAAECGLSHVLLEAEAHPAHTIFLYQKGKHVMAEPAVLPLRSPLPFEPGRREEVLAHWDEALRKHKVNIRYHSRVVAIGGRKGAFELQTKAGDRILAEHVVLAIGTQGNLRKLGVIGDDLPCVQYQLDDPEAYSDETIVVVGAGDAGAENALGLVESGNRVIIVNRNEDFARCKKANLELLTAAVRDERMEWRLRSTVQSVEMTEDGGKPVRVVLQTPKGEEVIGCDRVIARLGAMPPRKRVEGFGVQFPSEDPNAAPIVSSSYESSVPGMYVIGMLAGAQLIKQGINQGYEVVEHILGRAVQPADQPLLAQKFAKVRGISGVEQALGLIRGNVPLFADLTDLQLRELVLESRIKTPAPGTAIYEQGDYTSSFFTIVDGEVQIALRGERGGPVKVPLGKGDFFGEMGLLSGRRRSSTVLAGENCLLVDTPRRTMLRLIASVPSVRRIVDEVSIKRAVRSGVTSFAVGEHDLDDMVKDAQIRNFAADEVLFREGDAPDGLYLIRRGSVTISKSLGGREAVLFYLAAGNYVGEMALLSQSTRSATVRAAVATETILLKAETFNAVLARNPALRASLQERALARAVQTASREGLAEPSNLISFLIQQGMGEATDVLLIDESLCIRCDNCEKACADTHEGTSRLDREAGPTYANIHVPTSCRHCENPHCMKDCPPDAIHRDAGGEVYIENTCIGCGNCERNCPYGVIQLAQIDPERQSPSLLSWLFFGRGREPGREATYKSAEAVKKAVKCDMCKGVSGGAACVRACPTGAAIRVSPDRFLEYIGA
jgi:CRP-like cAMP-binding protein/thioredoxin reductase/Fe-S-cluster-containing hydrogenase component 2